MKKVLKIIPVLAFLVFFPSLAHAATLNLTVDKDTLTIGDEFHATISVDSEGAGINAAQATLKYDTSILEAEKVDKSNSVFTFWLVEPKYDNSAGEISFVGGATSGFTGKSLDILDVTFKVKGIGTASLVYTDSAVTASDGSGTNVLSSAKGLDIQILSKSEKSAIKPPQISREPTAAVNTPAKPKVSLPLYPDPSGWYNQSSDFSAVWELPGDVTEVATQIDKIPDSSPSKSEGLFDNKIFKALGNGVWYLHVRFKNNIGWGSTSHYRIAIDTVPPLPFAIDVSSGLSSDNPTPVLNYFSKDQFSGIDSYAIVIDGQDGIKTDKTTFTSEPLVPGSHDIVITALDKAGNATEARASIEILPIASPSILSVSKNNYAGEGGLSASGTAEHNMTILVTLRDEAGNEVLKTKTVAIDDGTWSISMDKPLKKGNYYIEIRSQDDRGAMSLLVKSGSIKVRERPVLTVAGLEITYAYFLIGLLALFIITFFGGWYIRHLAATQRERRIVIAARDVNAILTNIKGDIEKVMEKAKADGKANKNFEAEINFILDKVDQYITKSKNYVIEDIEEIE